MKCVVIGYGSIGKRHVRVLNELGHKVALVSQQKVEYDPTHKSLRQAVKTELPQYVVIANETYKHYDSICELHKIGYKGILLVEKPIIYPLRIIPINSFKYGYVGYNLRFHPILQRLKEILENERVIYTQVYVGQYLPNWRPESDYRRTYSCKRNQGGGVLLDLSHEFDYLLWFFGGWKSVVSIGGKYSNLEIDSEDLYSLLITMEKCPAVQLHLNYLDHIGRREISIITDRITVKADLVKNTLQINDDIFSFPIDRDYTYKAMHQKVLAGENDSLCIFKNGLEVLELIEATRESSIKRKWVIKR